MLADERVLRATDGNGTLKNKLVLWLDISSPALYVKCSASRPFVGYFAA
jgi:hypothetical protein